MEDIFLGIKKDLLLIILLKFCCGKFLETWRQGNAAHARRQTDRPTRVRSESRANDAVLSLTEPSELFVMIPFVELRWFFSLLNGSEQMVSSTFSQASLFLFIQLMYWIHGSYEFEICPM